MAKWLAMLAIVPLAAAAPAFAQMKGLSPLDVADIARSQTIDHRLTPESSPPKHTPLVRGMILRHEFAPNAALGVGFANIYAKRRAGSDMRSTERPSRSKKPAVSFVFKF